MQRFRLTRQGDKGRAGLAEDGDMAYSRGLVPEPAAVTPEEGHGGARVIAIRLAVFLVLAAIFAWSWANGYCH